MNGIFVASRSLSATYSAAGSARVIPVTMAAGAAAWLCVTQNITPHDIMRDSKWAKMVQDTLREGGADVGDNYPVKAGKPKKVTSSHDKR